jgi:hypothetical protein
MLIQYSNKLTLKCMRNIARINNIKYISNLPKYNLIKILNYHKASSLIQTQIRNKFMRDKECPISHETLKYPFVSILVNNKFFYYDLSSFLNYINITGDNRDPMTREPISDKKINLINKMIKYYYGKNTNKTIITKSMAKNADLNIIIYCLYDLLSELENTVVISFDYIYNNILPRLIYYVNYLANKHTYEDYTTVINAFRRSLSIIEKANINIIIDYIVIVLNSV